MGSAQDGEDKETRLLRKIAALERDADAARFDWFERRGNPEEKTLRYRFSLNAAALHKALAQLQRHRNGRRK